MSEQWAIAILSVVVGWVAYELRSIRAALDGLVKKDDCVKNMEGHCTDIRKLWDETIRQGERITKLEALQKGGN